MKLKSGLGTFKPYSQEMDWAYSTAPGAHIGAIWLWLESTGVHIQTQLHNNLGHSNFSQNSSLMHLS